VSKFGYVPELDGLRGVAILAVMLHHAGILKGGFIGVDVFFVISGYLITSLLVREYDSTGTIKLSQFYARRLLRLGPAMVILLTVYCVIGSWFLYAKAVLIEALTALFCLTNWARAFQFHPPNLLGHTWSLSIEEQFYVLWPITLWLLLRSRVSRKAIVWVAILVALSSWSLRILLVLNGASAMRLFNGLDTRLDGVMTGCALGVFFSFSPVQEWGRYVRWRNVAMTSAAIMLLVFSLTTHWCDKSLYYWKSMVVALCALAILMGLRSADDNLVKRCLVARWLVWVGSISYGLYLFHYPVFRVILRCGMNRWLGVTVAMIASFCIAAASFYLVEKPFLRLRKRFSRETCNPP